MSIRKIICVLGVLLLVIAFLGGCSNSGEKTSKSTDTSAKEIQVTPGTPATKPEQPKEEPVPTDLPYKEWLKRTITGALGENSNIGKPRVESIIFYNKEETEMEISLWADDNLTPGFIRDGSIIKSTEILRRIFADPRAKRVTLYWLFPAKTAYGQETSMTLMQIIMTRETANKINWSGFDPLKLPDVADKCSIHPSFKQ